MHVYILSNLCRINKSSTMLETKISNEWIALNDIE